MNDKSVARPVQGGTYWLQRRFETARGPFAASELIAMAWRGELMPADLVGSQIGRWLQVALVPQLKGAVEQAESDASAVTELLRSPDSGNRLLGVAKFRALAGRPHASLIAALLEMLLDPPGGDEPDTECRLAACESLVALGGPWATIGRVHHRHAASETSMRPDDSLRMLEERLGARGAFEIGVHLARNDKFLEAFVAMERSPESWHVAVVDTVPAAEALRRLHDDGSAIVTLNVDLLRRAIRERAEGVWKGAWPQLIRLEDDGAEQSVMLTLEGDGGKLDDGILEAAAAMVPARIWSDIEVQQMHGGLDRLPVFLAKARVFEGRSPKLCFRECSESSTSTGWLNLSPTTRFEAVHFNSCGRVHPSFVRELVPFICDELHFESIPELPDLSGADPGAVGKLRRIVVESVPVTEVPKWLRSGEGGLSQSLESLEMSRCRLEHLGDEPWNLPKLESLDLSSNSIMTLGQALVNLPSLAKLDLRNNRIQSIERSQWPDGAGQLDGPDSSITLSGNPLVQCDVVPYAAELNLDELPLRDLPRPYGQVRFLGTLLAPLGIRTLHERLASCQRLTDLAVSGTGLQELPAWLWRLPRLRRVQASKLRDLRIELGSHPMDPEEGSSRTLELEHTSFAPWSPSVERGSDAPDALDIGTTDDASLDLEEGDLELDESLDIDLESSVDLDDPDADGTVSDETDHEEADAQVDDDASDDESSDEGDWPNASFEISLAHAVVRELPEWLRDLPLSSLDISHTSIRRLPDWATGWDQLTEFRAEESCLEALPEDLDRWQACERIELGGSALRALPDSIGSLERLSRLELAGCPIRTLPRGLSDCTALETIDLDETLVSELPDWLFELEGLLYLKAGAPGLKSLPETIGRCRALSELYLANSGLETLPRAIGELQELEQIDLSNSSIRSLPAELERCKKLREIRLEGVRGLTSDSLELLVRLGRRVRIHAPPRSMIGLHLGLGAEPS